MIDDQPILQQVITFLDPIYKVALSRDHSSLVVASDGFDVFVYDHDGAKFMLLQSINYRSRLKRCICLADDGEHLAVGPANTADAFAVFKKNEKHI